jgi:rhodanese-related sulfurtransferase/predicted small lipoprotein YifL
MKRFLIALLVIVMVFSIVGCSEKAQDDATTDTDTDTPAEDTPSEGSGDAVADAANAYFANLDGNNIIEWADLFAMIEAGDEPFILSIRQQDVYDEGHIEGAYLASWGADLASKVSMLPTDVPVYVYCYSGQTAGQAIALMRMLGIEAYSVKTGFNFGATAVEGYEDYLSTTANELPDAGAEFDLDVLAFVEEYLNSVADNANFQIPPADAKTQIESGDVTFVDIRSAEDFEAAHVEGAINIPYGQGMQDSFADLPTDSKIIVTCYTGQTAGQTIAIMRALGYDAYSLQFGIKGAKGWITMVKAAAATDYFASFEANPMISPADLFTKMDAGEDLFILSIRQQDVYNEGHLKGAYLASWGADLAEKVAMLPTDVPVYVYCYTGQTAGQTVALLRMLGIDAYSIQSGYNSGVMAVEGYEAYIETTANELPDAGAEFDPFLLSAVVEYFNGVEANASYKISLEDAKAAVEAGGVTVLDIRQAEDYAAGHVEGAINLPFGKGMQESFGDLPTDQQIIVACYSGQTAGQTTAVLRMLGYNAVSMHLGMKLGWIAEGYPVVTD